MEALRNRLTCPVFYLLQADERCRTSELLFLFMYHASLGES